MSSVDILTFASSAVILGLAYVIVCTVNGYLQTWFIDKLGDPTAKELGYLALSPERHIDLVGFIACVLLGIGWHMPVPINAQRIQGYLRLLRVLLAYLTSTLCALILAMGTLVVSLAVFGENPTYRFLSIVFHSQEKLDFGRILSIFEGYSSSVILIGLLIAASIVLNLYIAVLNFIYNMIRLFLFIGVEKSYTYANHSENILTFGTLLGFFLFKPFVSNIFFSLIIRAAHYITYFLGILS